MGAEGDAKKKTNKGQVPATIALDDDEDFLPGFHCYICGSSFEGKDEVDTHIRDYHDPQPEHTDAFFRSQGDINRHHC